MALGGGGSSKIGGNRGGGGGGGRLPYGIVLLLAFGAAVFGVMVLHKFRERRIFSMLMKDKDSHILTLQLLLQKEKDYTKEMKKKIEELKAKANSLRTQKIELNNKLMDMHSVITSLKEEGKGLESELEEKQNELRLLEEKEMDTSKEDSQVVALTELLKQKEAEIEDMKRRLEKPVNVWSVSADDPSKPLVSSSAIADVTSKAKAEVPESKNDGEKTEALSTKGEGGNETEKGEAQSDTQAQVVVQKLENKPESEASRNGGEGDDGKNPREGQDSGHSEDSQTELESKNNGETGNKNQTDVVSGENNVSIMKDGAADTKAVDANKNKENLVRSEHIEGRILSKVSDNGVKKEIAEGQRELGSRSKTMKKWRSIISHNKKLENGNPKEGAVTTLLTMNGSDQDEGQEKKLGEANRETNTDSSDQVGVEPNENGTSSSGETLRTTEKSEDGKGHRLRGENGETLGSYNRKQAVGAIDGEEKSAYTYQAVVSADDGDSGMKERNADSVQQKTDLEDIMAEDLEAYGMESAVTELPARHSTVLKKQKRLQRMKGRKIPLPGVANNRRNQD